MRFSLSPIMLKWWDEVWERVRGAEMLGLKQINVDLLYRYFVHKLHRRQEVIIQYRTIISQKIASA